MNPAGEKFAGNEPGPEENRPGQGRGRVFTVLALLWMFPSLGALVVIGLDFLRWFDSPTLLEGLGRIRFEQWIALGLLVFHALFVGLAVRFHRTESPRQVATL